MTRAAIKHGEERLRAAMLAGDVAALDELLDDTVLFVAPDGALVRKDDDLELHRSGAQKLTKLSPRELAIELYGHDVAIASALVDLEGTLRGQPFAGTYRYVRTWRRNESGDWRVIAAAAIALRTA